jgi:hypothetical protein
MRSVSLDRMSAVSGSAGSLEGDMLYLVRLLFYAVMDLSTASKYS